MATAGDPWHLTFLMGRWCMKSSTACLLASILHWPLGLFLSEQTLAIRVFGAIPATGNTPVTLHGYTAVLLQEPPGGPIGLVHSCPPPGTSRRSYWTGTQLSSSRNLQESYRTGTQLSFTRRSYRTGTQLTSSRRSYWTGTQLSSSRRYCRTGALGPKWLATAVKFWAGSLESQWMGHLQLPAWLTTEPYLLEVNKFFHSHIHRKWHDSPDISATA